jgi:hypothetical protein
MAARKRKSKATSNYVVSLDLDDLKRESDNFFGKLRSNFVGSDFTIYDAGSKPEKKRSKKKEVCDRGRGRERERERERERDSEQCRSTSHRHIRDS